MQGCDAVVRVVLIDVDFGSGPFGALPGNRDHMDMRLEATISQAPTTVYRIFYRVLALLLNSRGYMFCFLVREIIDYCIAVVSEKINIINHLRLKTTVTDSYQVFLIQPAQYSSSQ